MDGNRELIQEIWDTYIRFVYTIELSLEWVNSPLFTSDRPDSKLHSVRKYLNVEQNNELDDYLKEITSALFEVAEKSDGETAKKVQSDSVFQ